ncbi:MAG: AbiJ-NTD4 domain-containing protein [Kiloniellales bacterium]
MSNAESIDRSQLTFSQAEGLAPLPGPLQLHFLSAAARAYLWKTTYDLINNSKRETYSGFEFLSETWKNILEDAHVYFFHKPVDEYSYHIDDTIKYLKPFMLRGKYNEVFDFIEFILRHPRCPGPFLDGVIRDFQRSHLAYTVAPEAGPSIVPAVTEQEGNAIKKAFETLSDHGLSGARVHLQKASENINAGRYADSVREAIHAVESVAQKLSDKADKTLDPALNELAKNIQLHPALKTGFSKLYGYSSNEKGVRHALHDDEAKVDMHDAVFMLGACASFVTYLVGKSRDAGLLER